ncbi:hypothetical protein BBD32_12655 [Elizabethkingia anophelis]|uniref:Rhodanese domain-containing protein n=2 Tax=Elizabethkingia anophelis TaxID=1117645 RepID=A0AAU8UXW2_9FLAO|nr:hypothetical protein BBD32_12655 [Elizabethkingia anophelis]OPB63767.1 hypothetical protein BAY11_16825 [Elizabethkingia anophelis]
MVSAQKITMNFPAFGGKAYEFVIFRGEEYKVLLQDTIPKDGKFTIELPKAYSPYEGMSRWLLRTEEGGGLDMYIPGHDFGVSCESSTPSESTIFYTNNTGNTELNRLYKEQESILNRYQAMILSKRVFGKEYKNYGLFEQEYESQRKSYLDFQQKLSSRGDYISDFLRIVNITVGQGTILTEDEKKKAENISMYISNELNWDRLYTSGHWLGIISSWVDIECKVLQDKKSFVKEFNVIGNKLEEKKYGEFAARVAHYLKSQNREDYIAALYPEVFRSGKVKNYEGFLELYKEEGEKISKNMLKEKGLKRRERSKK